MSRVTVPSPTGWQRVPGGWRRGEGPPRRVFLPGLRADAREWAPLSEALDAAPAWFFDLPRSGPDLRHIADAVSALLPDEPVEVVGASFGGLVARALPASRVRSLVLIGTLPFPSAHSRLAGVQARLVRALPERAFRALYALRSDAEWLEDEPDGRWLAHVPVPERDDTADRLAAIGRWGLPARLEVPARWLWGREDRWARWSEAEIRALGAEAMVIPGGHRPHLSFPAEVARRLDLIPVAPRRRG